jgi:MFS family permease
MHVNHPIWLRTVSTPGAVVFAIMFTLESLARASLATVIPLQAYALLQDARDVSLLYFGVGATGLIGSFTIPLLIRRLRRRWVYSMGVGLFVLAAALLATGTLAGQASGMLIRAFATACTNISLSLYVMDYIRKRDFVRTEPLRLMFSAFAWIGGPSVGVLLYREVAPWAAEVVSAASATLLFVYFWYLRLQENPAVAAATRPPPNPLKSIARFLAQPRLRLAWIIPFGRSSWWAMFFVYPPLYLVQAGVGELPGALLVSAGNALLILTPLVGRVAGRYGLRPLIIGALVASGIFDLLAVIFFAVPAIVAASLLAAAVCAVVLDAVGNIPFLRSVHPYERPQMTTVFRTYIDFSQMLPAAVFALLLTFFDMRAVFATSACLMLGTALVARYLPRRM